jgi:hypothetical protein
MATSGPHDGSDTAALQQVPESARVDLGGKCWWCGAAANSGEHKFKRSDLVREFGSGAWTGTDAVSHGSGDRASLVNSSRADRLKFPKNMCRDCNNVRSQSMDTAYDRFADYIVANEEQVLKARGFRWPDVFSDDWKSGRDDVVRFWIKHICTRLATDGVPIDRSVIAFLDGAGGPPRHLQLSLVIRLDVVALAIHLREVHGDELGGSFWMGDMACYYSPSRNVIHEAWSHWGMRWLWLDYRYRLDKAQGSNNFWRKRVRLPSGFAVDPSTIPSQCGECNPGQASVSDRHD